MRRIDRIRRHYEPRMAPGRASHQVLDWASAESQRKRFEVLAASVPLAGGSLLDVGCGMGDLPAFLDTRGLAVDYTGVDVLEKMVAACRTRHPGRRFLHLDVFAGERPPPIGTFDVAFCSGTFNLNLGNNLEFLPRAIARLMELSRRYVVFNLLHIRSAGKDSRYFCYDPGLVRAILDERACEVRLIDDYLPNDFTVICRKKGQGSRA